MSEKILQEWDHILRDHLLGGNISIDSIDSMDSIVHYICLEAMD